ncbi:hypothetical protein M3Y98_00908700 [Aphelenchoides besseyi]|nr:hypothetical protein M3Y98_00908700 [Aphelenchoides besseyi]KAI6193555.1 hypothetical protein M3Y96_01030600 [Aphelenchoides besseyi]
MTLPKNDAEATIPATTRINFTLNEDVTIEANRALNYASGFLKDFVATVQEPNTTQTVPLNDRATVEDINVLNKFSAWIDDKLHDELRENADNGYFWTKILEQPKNKEQLLKLVEDVKHNQVVRCCNLGDYLIIPSFVAFCTMILQDHTKTSVQTFKSFLNKMLKQFNSGPVNDHSNSLTCLHPFPNFLYLYWKEMMKKFISNVPQETNRRIFRTHVDSFTGIRATDTMTQVLLDVFPERKIDRSNSIRVLQKYIEDQVIEDVVDGKNRQFKDDTTLVKETAYAKADVQPPVRVRRTASLNGTENGNTTPANRSRKLNGDAVRLIKHRSFQDGLNESRNRAPLAFQDDEEEDESPPKQLRIRYARSEEREHSTKENQMFWTNQLHNLLDGIIEDTHLNEKERHDKLMKFKHHYPHIFEKRYPNDSYIPPQLSLLDRFKNFIGPS